MKPLLLALLLAASSAAPLRAAEVAAPTNPPPPPLRHAVICPPFKGDPELAPIYHDALLDALRSCPRIELLPPFRRSRPTFTYRIDGRILPPQNPGALAQVVVTITDLAHNECISSQIAPADKNASLKHWKNACLDTVTRTANAIPFECLVSKQKRKQNSYSIDRGASAGIQPGQIFSVAEEEDELLSPETGEAIGRNSPRAFGKILIFRTSDQSAYGRPCGRASFPKTRGGRIVAREF